MKQTIRLTESDLHNLIKSCVRNVLNESDYMDDGNLEGQYYKNPDSMWTYGTNLNPAGVDGLDPHSIRRSGNGNKNADNRASWDYFDAVRNGADMKMRGRLNAHANRQPNKWELYDYMYGWNEEKGDYDTPMSMFKDNLDKQWQDTKDKEKYSKMADSRPLHRKGSLNRAMEESIRKTVNKILREEVDMGQLDAMKKTPTKDAPAEVKKEIRRLRQQIDDYEQEGKDISTLQKKIQQLKYKYYN